MCARIEMEMNKCKFHWTQLHVHGPSASRGLFKSLFEMCKTNKGSIRTLKAWKLLTKWCLVVRSFCPDFSWCLCLKFCFRIHRYVCWLAVSCPARKTKKLVVATRVLILFVSSNAALFLSHNLSRNSVRCVLLCIASLITSSLLQVCPSASCSVPSFLAFNFCPKLLIVASQICAPLFLSYLTCILGFQN